MRRESARARCVGSAVCHVRQTTLIYIQEERERQRSWFRVLEPSGVCDARPSLSGLERGDGQLDTRWSVCGGS